MNLNDFNFTLPPERIAQTPAARRDASRLMIVDRQQRITHDVFANSGFGAPRYPLGNHDVTRRMGNVSTHPKRQYDRPSDGQRRRSPGGRSSGTHSLSAGQRRAGYRRGDNLNPNVGNRDAAGGGSESQDRLVRSLYLSIVSFPDRGCTRHEFSSAAVHAVSFCMCLCWP